MGTLEVPGTYRRVLPEVVSPASGSRAVSRRGPFTVGDGYTARRTRRPRRNRLWGVTSRNRQCWLKKASAW